MVSRRNHQGRGRARVPSRKYQVLSTKYSVLSGEFWIAAPLLGVAIMFAVCGCEPGSRPASTNSPPVNKPDDQAGSTPASAESPATTPQATESPLFKEWPKPVVAFVLTGQQIGYIEPCGCTGLANQKGGLARRQTFLRQLTSERDWVIVPLDVGSQVKRLGKQQEIKFEFAIKGLRSMGYRGITLGEGDLRLTPGEVLSTISGEDAAIKDVVSANVAVLARELMPRTLVFEAGGKRIGVTAVLGEKYESRLQGDEIVHEPPLATAKSSAAELKSKACDLLVLLAHAPVDEARKLAREVPDFDLVVASGETSTASRELEKVSGTKTSLLQVGLKAMYAGVVGVFNDSQNPLRYESVPLDARFADSPEMLKLLADYQERLKELGLAELGIKPQPHPTGNKFVGSEKCGECHTKAMEIWSKTPHAHATDSLTHPPNSRGEIARHFDPECLSCHVTGWDPQKYFPYDSGYLSLERSPLLNHNGCENCHGPGSAHVAVESGERQATEDEIKKLRDAMKLPLADEVAERKCMECHDEDNSPDFHKPGAFEKYWQEVAHRGKD